MCKYIGMLMKGLKCYMNFFKTITIGIILGISNVIPGVSGGTMAVILNVYDKILFAISLKNIKTNLKFLIPLALGAGIGIILFSKLMILLFSNHEALLNFCFIGIIIGSIPMIYKRARFEKVKNRSIVIFIFSLFFMLFLFFLGQGDISNKTISEVGGMNTSVFLWLFFSSTIGAMAMILPGISGSFMLLLLGTYTMTIEAISQLDFIILIPIFLGILLGCFIGVKSIKKMLRFHPQALYFGILGLVIGSIFIIYPGFVGNNEDIVSILLLCFFCLLTSWFSRKAT